MRLQKWMVAWTYYNKEEDECLKRLSVLVLAGNTGGAITEAKHIMRDKRDQLPDLKGWREAGLNVEPAHDFTFQMAGEICWEPISVGRLS